MPKHFSKTSLTITLLAIITAIGAFLYIHKNYPTPIVAPQQNQPASQAPAQTTPPASTAGNPPAATPPSGMPNTFSLAIPFTPQAPTGNWDELHNEACEEAAAIMANAYLTGDTETRLPAARVESEISTLTDWEKQHFGYYLDTTAAETTQMIEGVYGLHTQILQGYTEDDIKQALLKKEVVIIPEDGQELGNPNYKTPGPIYHMLVIRGYSGNTIITNDSGTRNGLNYPYSFSTIYDSGADWNHSTNTIDHTHIMIIVSK